MHQRGVLVPRVPVAAEDEVAQRVDDRRALVQLHALQHVRVASRAPPPRRPRSPRGASCDLVRLGRVRALAAPVEEGDAPGRPASCAAAMSSRSIRSIAVDVASSGRPRPGVRLGGDHLGRLDVAIAEEEVAEEGDAARPFTLDDRGPARLGQVPPGAEVGDASLRRASPGCPAAPPGRSPSGGCWRGSPRPRRPQQRGHELGPRAEVEVLGDLLAALGERALEVDHEQVGRSRQRPHLREAVANISSRGGPCFTCSSNVLLVVVAERHVAAEEHGDRAGRLTRSRGGSGASGATATGGARAPVEGPDRRGERRSMSSRNASAAVVAWRKLYLARADRRRVDCRALPWPAKRTTSRSPTSTTRAASSWPTAAGSTRRSRSSRRRSISIPTPPTRTTTSPPSTRRRSSSARRSPSTSPRIKLEPDSATAHYNLACFLSTHATEMAIAEYKEAIELDPEYPDAHLNLGPHLRGPRAGWKRR